jgi:hypothetical protein
LNDCVFSERQHRENNAFMIRCIGQILATAAASFPGSVMVIAVMSSAPSSRDAPGPKWCPQTPQEASQTSAQRVLAEAMEKMRWRIALFVRRSGEELRSGAQGKTGSEIGSRLTSAATNSRAEHLFVRSSSELSSAPLRAGRLLAPSSWFRASRRL